MVFIINSTSDNKDKDTDLRKLDHSCFRFSVTYDSLFEPETNIYQLSQADANKIMLKLNSRGDDYEDLLKSWVNKNLDRHTDTGMNDFVKESCEVYFEYKNDILPILKTQSGLQ